ncbi:MAG: NnrU family protein [Oceanicaulis sp.]|nr:NnrU family protein [Oceanicaulis sp.]
MDILIIGLALFLGVHMTRLIGLRGPLVRVLSAPLYAIFYSVISAVGLALIIYGHILSHPSPSVWTPPEWTRTAALFAVPVSLVLLTATYLPSHIRSLTRHPMTLGVCLWSGAHLIANGELASLVLFGSFFVWSALLLIEGYARGGRFERPGIWAADIAAIVIGLGAAALFAYFHMQLFGVAVIEFASEPGAPGI